MRGLDTRVALAQARILKLVDAEGGKAAEYEAYIEAECEGYHDAAANLHQPPVQFADEPILLAGWKSGHRANMLMYEMDHCDGCNDGTGNPCRIHG